MTCDVIHYDQKQTIDSKIFLTGFAGILKDTQI